MGGFRSTVQDLLVPELKSFQVKVDAVEQRLQRIDSRLSSRIDKLRIWSRFEKLESFVKKAS